MSDVLFYHITNDTKYVSIEGILEPERDYFLRISKEGLEKSLKLASKSDDISKEIKKSFGMKGVHPAIENFIGVSLFAMRHQPMFNLEQGFFSVETKNALAKFAKMYDDAFMYDEDGISCFNESITSFFNKEVHIAGWMLTTHPQASGVHMAVVINDDLLYEAKAFFENTVTTELETGEDDANSSEDRP